MRISLNEEKRLVITVKGTEHIYKIKNVPIRNQRENIFPVVDSILEKSKYISNLMDKAFLDYVKTRDGAALYKAFLQIKWGLLEFCKKEDLFKVVRELEIVQRSKKKQIFFDTSEMLAVLAASVSLKFYTIFYSTDLRPDKDIHSKIFANLLQTLSKEGILNKLYKLIQIKVFASATSNKPFWQYLKFVTGDSPETVCIDTYVNILENVLPVLDCDKNPITYLVVYAKNVVDYIFISAYPDAFFYESMFFYDSTESQQGQGDTLLPVLMVKQLIEKIVTPAVLKRYELSPDLTKQIVEPNPLTELIAIPFFAALTNTKTSMYRELNLYYHYTISLYMSIVLSYTNFHYLSKLLTCAAKKVKKTTKPRISNKTIVELQGYMNPVLAKTAEENKLIQKLVSRLRDCDFTNIKTDVTEPLNENKLIEEVSEFYRNFFSGKFGYTLAKLKENNLDCFCL